MFVPSKVAEINPNSTIVDLFKSFPFLDNVATLDALKAELRIYLAKSAEVSPGIDTLQW